MTTFIIVFIMLMLAGAAMARLASNVPAAARTSAKTTKRRTATAPAKPPSRVTSPEQFNRTSSLLTAANALA